MIQERKTAMVLNSTTSSNLVFNPFETVKGGIVPMTYTDVLSSAREKLGPYCKGCAVCNGRACGSRIPGPGAVWMGK